MTIRFYETLAEGEGTLDSLRAMVLKGFGVAPLFALSGVGVFAMAPIFNEVQGKMLNFVPALTFLALAFAALLWALLVGTSFAPSAREAESRSGGRQLARMLLPTVLLALLVLASPAIFRSDPVTALFALLTGEARRGGVPQPGLDAPSIRLFAEAFGTAMVSFLALTFSVPLGIPLLRFARWRSRQCLRGHGLPLGRIRKLMEQWKGPVERGLKGRKEPDLLLVELPDGAEELLYGPLTEFAVFNGLMTIVAVAALTATGEGFILQVTGAFFLLSLALGCFLPARRGFSRFHVAVLMSSLPILLVIRMPSGATEWALYGLAAALGAIGILRGLVEYWRGRKPRFLAVTDGGLSLIRCKGRSGCDVLPLSPEGLRVDEDWAAFRLEGVGMDGQTFSAFRVHSRVEMEALVAATEGGPLALTLPAPRPALHAANSGSRAPMVVAATFFFWLYYSMVGYGLALGLLCIPQLPAWTAGDAAKMLGNSRLTTRFFPFGAVGQIFRASSAFSGEAWEEAARAVERGRALTSHGQAGSLLALYEKARFGERCRAMAAIGPELDGAKAAEGVPAAAHRAFLVARRMVEIASMAELWPVAGGYPRSVVRRLRSAAEGAGDADPRYRLELARALAGLPPYGRGPSSPRYVEEEHWAEEALGLVDGLAGKVDDGELQAIRKQLVSSGSLPTEEIVE